MNKEMKQGIKDFIAEVNPMIKVYFQSYDLECDVFEEKVYIGRTYDRRTDEYFANFVHELNPQCNFNPFLLSILHEIGHIETWTDEDADDKDVTYAILKMQFDSLEKTDLVMKEYCDMYFRIPLEQNATQWGIDFAMSHPDLMKKYSWLHN